MFATAGVVIPVIIHFWNRKQGKTLKVGSVSLLIKSYKQQAKSLQLQERLLLLLRCLLILLVAFLLSRPVWEQRLNASKQQGWILMEQQGLQQTYTHFKPLIDSLIAQHYEFHYFDAGFKKANLETVLKINKDVPGQNDFSYWSLLASLDKQVPASLPVYLFTASSVKRFSGSRPHVAMKLRWHAYTAKDSIAASLANAYLTTSDSIRLVIVTSKPSGTSYFYENTAIAPQQTGDYSIQTANNNISVSYQNKQAVKVDTTTLKIAIFTDRYGNDAAYIKAVFEAIRQYSKRKIQLSLTNNPAGIPHRQDWVFWLSDQPVSTANGNNIFMYEKGRVNTVVSSIHASNNEDVNEHISLYKRIPYQPSGLLKTIWADGFGDPLLQLENSRVYHFFSRFDPSWNDLPWSNAFPKMMFKLVFDTQRSMPVSDNRIIDDQQLQPVFTAENKPATKRQSVITHDLSGVLWITAFIVFFVERYLSYRTKMEKTNG